VSHQFRKSLNTIWKLLGNRTQAQLKWEADEKNIVKKLTNIRKQRKSQDSRIKTLFAEIFDLKS
jgi:hypothetical protein